MVDTYLIFSAIFSSDHDSVKLRACAKVSADVLYGHVISLRCVGTPANFSAIYEGRQLL